MTPCVYAFPAGVLLLFCLLSSGHCVKHGSSSQTSLNKSLVGMVHSELRQSDKRRPSYKWCRSLFINWRGCEGEWHDNASALAQEPVGIAEAGPYQRRVVKATSTTIKLSRASTASWTSVPARSPWREFPRHLFSDGRGTSVVPKPGND